MSSWIRGVGRENMFALDGRNVGLSVGKRVNGELLGDKVEGGFVFGE